MAWKIAAMDRIDREILGLLARDGRLSFRELGESVHLSANAVAERFRRLQGSGVIRHIRAEIDPVALGRALEAQIEVKLAAETAALAFETAPGQAINFHRGTWHGVLTPLHAPGLFAVIDRIGEGANLEEHWFKTPFTIRRP